MPDFVIAGAAKSGTSAMFSYLGAHPGIATSSKKEPHFWSPDRGPGVDRDGYAKLWDGGRPGALKGEASVSYLVSRIAVPAIVATCPETRFIVMLRKPADMANAYYSEMVKWFQEDAGSVEEAWRLQDVRAAGMRVPAECEEPRRLQYREVCALGDQLERLFSIVAPQFRHVILYDDFAANPRAAYQDTLRFLGLADNGRTAFERINANSKNLRSPRFAAVHRQLGRSLGPLYGPARAIAARVGVSPSKLVDRFNVRIGPRSPIDPRVRTEVLEYFRPQVEKVEALLGRNLSNWKKP
jgi:hypothetical protein